MGTERFGKGELKGGAGDAKSEPPPLQAAVAMTTPTVLGRGRPGRGHQWAGGGRAGLAVLGGGRGGRVLKHQLPLLRTE